MASPSLERKEPQGRPLYSFELADIIGASMTPEMLYERWVVQREELETARTSESEHQGRYAQDPIRRRGLVSAGYTGYRNRRKPAGTKKSIRRMIQELALPPHRRDATPFATKTSRSWKKSSSASSPRPEAAQTSRSWKTYASRGVGTPSCCGGPRPVAAETSRSWKKIPIGGKQQPRFTRPKRGPCGFMGPLKPTVPRTPKTREERKKEGTEAMRMPRKKKVPSIFSRIASCRPDYVKMGQQRGKTTSFEVWQRQQREIARKEEEERAAAEAAAAAAAEEEEAEAAAAAELDPAQQSVPLRSGRGALLNGKSATLELSEHEHHDPSADHSRGRSLQPQHIDKLHHKKTGEVDDDGDDGDKKEGEEEEEKEEGEEETDSEKSSSYASSTKSIRVAERPKMPRWAPGFM
ncbi:hypothetical protein Pmar_PMAR026498 [Perkinsus marinus ATCC 50983]|uniref:Uncharacterized protein n=1 Tax=Perkinsus marinus (strain ATCC 50983 / TXsc) TaxID=423536 RepID=C5LDQ0_PERM5|nr:hypothetical protein Pmar_PMAR026498 [Perkinsus marinus ATCC 50983]EER05064.1 hypothetical protein Pmar_PMAR026498 [Perkinsus marinus ATCC 50983]|eukprot:XP_002773248.1 hypothetical protein Pmar_PMAR026498 [Perkinsus marinus ATCC 50983]